jgi:hypothetical protein
VYANFAWFKDMDSEDHATSMLTKDTSESHALIPIGVTYHEVFGRMELYG